ncbi:MAG: hypothetical protein QOI59_4897, partial [Gammaproteobacteria bacterium]|nr:hypothetical protein [Gammaproteobacteria bacterium]
MGQFQRLRPESPMASVDFNQWELVRFGQSD